MRMNLGVVLLALCSANLLARGPAQVTIDCTSLRFAPATGGPGQTYTLQLTTDSSLSELNQELAPLYDPTMPSHGSFFELDDPTSLETISGQIAFDTPAPTDLNGNGFDDFFEVSQPVPATKTQGLFQTPVDQGTVTATWSRAAGSTTGTCTLQLTGQVFGRLPDFNHVFEVLESRGTLEYAPTTNGIPGTLKLAPIAGLTNTLTGTVHFQRVATNRFNQLTLQAGTLTNALNQALTYSAAEVDRDLILGTNYYGYLEFADGDPSTSTLDYREWVLSIDDPNDANGNGIPDLSDDVQSTGAQPTLSLARAGTGLALSISAAPGSVVDLQEAVSIVQTNWTVLSSITLTNNPQLVPLPIPNSATRFWRVRTR